MEFTASTQPGFYARDRHRYRPISLTTGRCLTAAEALERLLAEVKRVEARPRRVRVSAFDEAGESLGELVVSIHEAKVIIASLKSRRGCKSQSVFTTTDGRCDD